eukprot:2216408-Pyramimonas_sp.AAC.1
MCFILRIPQQHVLSLLAGASRPLVRLASLVLRRRTVRVRIQHPTKTAAFPSGDPDLRTSLENVCIFLMRDALE